MADDFSLIVISKFDVAIEMRGIRMQEERAIFHTATPAQIAAIPLLKKIDWLLPKGFRSEVTRPFFPPVNQNHQSI